MFKTMYYLLTCRTNLPVGAMLWIVGPAGVDVVVVQILQNWNELLACDMLLGAKDEMKSGPNLQDLDKFFDGFGRSKTHRDPCELAPFSV